MAECPSAMLAFGVAAANVDKSCKELFVGDVDQSGDLDAAELAALTDTTDTATAVTGT